MESIFQGRKRKKRRSQSWQQTKAALGEGKSSSTVQRLHPLSEWILLGRKSPHHISQQELKICLFLKWMQSTVECWRRAFWLCRNLSITLNLISKCMITDKKIDKQTWHCYVCVTLLQAALNSILNLHLIEWQQQVALSTDHHTNN